MQYEVSRGTRLSVMFVVGSSGRVLAGLGTRMQLLPIGRVREYNGISRYLVVVPRLRIFLDTEL